MRKLPECLNNTEKEDRSGHYQDVHNENKNFHQYPQFNHNDDEKVETELDLDRLIEDSRISSTSLVKELIRRLSVNELPLYQQNISPDLNFITERYKLINGSREDFMTNKRSSTEGKLSDFKPQSAIKKNNTVDDFKYITTEEAPPILRKYHQTSTGRTIITDDKYSPVPRLTTYQQRDPIGADINREDVEKFIDTVQIDKIKPNENEKEQPFFHAIENPLRRSFDRHNPYQPSTSVEQPVSVSKIGGKKPWVARAEDIEKYKSFLGRSTLRDQYKPKYSDNK